MNDATPFILSSSEQSFEQDVIQQSHERLVMADFWAAWCGPCRSLTPVLERLVAQFDGAVALVKIDTEAEPGLASTYGIRSLPTVILFLNGQAVDQFMGAQPEASVRAILERYISRESDLQLARAVELRKNGQTTEAFALLQEIVANDSTNDRPKLELAEWLLEQNSHEDAGVVLDSVSQGAKGEMRYRGLKTRLDLSSELDSASSMDVLRQRVADSHENLEARFQLALRLVNDDQLSDALDHLLEIVRRDRTFQNDSARQTILKIFNLEKADRELVSHYRKLLAQTLN